MQQRTKLKLHFTHKNDLSYFAIKMIMYVIAPNCFVIIKSQNKETIYYCLDIFGLHPLNFDLNIKNTAVDCHVVIISASHSNICATHSKKYLTAFFEAIRVIQVTSHPQ